MKEFGLFYAGIPVVVVQPSKSKHSWMQRIKARWYWPFGSAKWGEYPLIGDNVVYKVQGLSGQDILMMTPTMLTRLKETKEGE